MQRRSCPVRDMIMRWYDQELLGAPLWCMTQQEEGLWIQGVNIMVPQRQVFVCASEFALDESLSHKHMGAVYHRGRSPSASTKESHGGGRDYVSDQELLGAPLRVTRELDCFSAHIHLRELGKSEDKAEWSKGARKRRRVRRGSATQKAKRRLERWTRRSTTVPQRRIYRSRRKGRRCKATDSRAMGLVAPWYRRGGTSVESSILCSHGGRALVVKGAEKVENAQTNSKYEDRAEGQRSRNFIRPRGIVRVTRELDCFSAHIRLREPGKSEDKADKPSVRKEVDSEERHSIAEADLSIAKEGT
ncbi:hypothetical protein B296_00038726 [Ensete ventricosum]|uniref:Uncharacterized protein n=1 Tax=Ensete ventricosum TaxID=4639 RepID=A0A426XMV1_ENSVE|nr:hypothetical protein B296_00038726 [Ensete ventricosum]